MRHNDQWSAWLLQCDDDVDDHQSTDAFCFRHIHINGSSCTTVGYDTVLYAGRITADIVLQWLRLQPGPDSSLYLTLICYLSNLDRT